METKEQFEAKHKSEMREGFRDFMQQPLLRAMLAKAPPSEDMEVLLQTAYEHGYNSGAVRATIGLMKMITEQCK